MKPYVGVINYSVNNINSITKFLDKLDISYKIINNPIDLTSVGYSILPGVGSFNQGMYNLIKSNFNEAILKYVKSGNFLMGICLGMQLLFNESEEYSGVDGLKLISGKCHKIPTNSVRVPHIGWNEIIVKEKSKLLPLDNDKNYLAYFVHSYFVKPKNQSIITSETIHGLEFCSSIEHENIFGFQFHPEKSFDIGFKIFNNFLSLK